MTHLKKWNPGDYDDWRWGGQAINPPGQVSGASLQEIGATGVFAWTFTNNTAMVLHDLQVSHGYAEGTEILPHIHFSPSTTGTYTGVWSLRFVQWLSADNGTPMLGPTTINAPFDAVMTALAMQSIDFTENLVGAGGKISRMMHAVLSLTLTSGASLHLNGVDGHFLRDSVGSESPVLKGA